MGQQRRYQDGQNDGMHSLYYSWEAHMPCLNVSTHAHAKLQYIYLLLKIVRWITFVVCTDFDPRVLRSELRRARRWARGALRCQLTWIEAPGISPPIPHHALPTVQCDIHIVTVRHVPAARLD